MNQNLRNEDFGIAISGFTPELITKPFNHQIPKINKLLIFNTDHPKSLDTVSTVENILDYLGIIVESYKINDIYNFYQIYFCMEYFVTKWGKPKWINTTSGPGLAISAMALYAQQNKIDLVAYDKISESVKLISTNKLDKFQKNRKKYIPLLMEVEENPKAMADIAKSIEVSKSTLSRQISVLKRMGIVKITGSGNRYSPFTISLTEWGKKYLNISRKTQ